MPLHYIAHSFCPATLNGVLESCLQKYKFYRGVPEPPGTPPPYAPDSTHEVTYGATRFEQCYANDNTVAVPQLLVISHEQCFHACMHVRTNQLAHATLVSITTKT